MIRSTIKHFIFHAVDEPSRTLISIDISFPLWNFMQTQKVAAAATFIVDRPCCISFKTIRNEIVLLSAPTSRVRVCVWKAVVDVLRRLQRIVNVHNAL